MSNLISGKEALNNWNEAQVNNIKNQNSYWCDLKYCGFTIPEIMACESNGMELIFRLKPKTILINGVEVPALFKQKHGDVFWHIDVREICLYNHKQEWSDSDEFLQLGAWRTEDEIKQVIEALRKVFNHG